MPKRSITWLFWAAYSVTAAWAVMTRLAMGRPERPPLLLMPLFWTWGVILANAITGWLALRIRRDYPVSSKMRTAWLLIACSAGSAVLRMGIQWALFLTRRVGFRTGARPGLPATLPAALFLNLLSLLLLLAGLCIMGVTVARLVGFRLRLPDYVLIAAIVALVPALVGIRDQAYASGFAAPAIRRFQQLDPLLIAAFALAAVALRRLGREIRGGAMATSFYYVAGFALVRLAALLVRITPWGNTAAVLLPITSASLASDWLVTLVVYHRWRLTTTTLELAVQYEKAADERHPFP